MDIGVTFVGFDFKKGPNTIYCYNLSDEFSDKLALRTMVSGLSGNENKDESSYYGESIIPFPKYEKIAFSKFFPMYETVDKTDEPRACILSVVFPLSEKNVLFSLSSILSNKLDQISAKIQSNNIFPLELDSEIKNSFNLLTKIENLKNSS